MPDNSVGSSKASTSAEHMPVVGIDLGGTKISAALVKDNKLSSETEKVPTPKGPDNIMSALLDLVAKFKDEHLVFGVGIATAGIVNPDTGEVVGSTGNLPGWAGTKIKKIIESKTALRCHVENDANASGYGEYCAAENLADKRCIVTVTLGTGIGVGIVIDGQIYRGAHFAAGECGHIKISMDNRRRCTCDLWDCWEAYGSGRGLVATAWELLEGVKPEQSSLAALREKLVTQDVINAARDGDAIGQKSLQRWHEHVANGLVSLCHTLDPDVFIITGGMAQFVDFTCLRELVADRTLPRVSEKLEIHPSILGEAGGMVGAAGLVVQAARAADRVGSAT
jgi:glucokinase